MFKNRMILAALFSGLLLAGCNAGGGAPVDLKDEGKMMEEGSDEMAMELPEVIKIGFISPLTGNVASFGQDGKAAVEAYFTQNPTIGDSAVEVIYEDGKCNGQDAANAAQKLINIDKVQVIIGGLCSGETLAAAPIADANKVVLISAASSSPEISSAGDYIFRNYPSDAGVAKTLVNAVLEESTSIALLTEQTDYAQGYRAAIQSHLESLEKSDLLVLDEAFAADNTDFRTLLAKVADSGADALVLIPQSPVTGGFGAKQAKEIGLDIQIYSGDAIVGPDFFDTAKDAGEGVKAFLASENPSRDGYDEITAAIGEPQASIPFQLFAYDAAQLVAETIAEVGYDGTAIKDAFNSMETFVGVASDINFDENGDNNVDASLKIAKDGEFVLAE